MSPGPILLLSNPQQDTGGLWSQSSEPSSGSALRAQGWVRPLDVSAPTTPPSPVTWQRNLF